MARLSSLLPALGLLSLAAACADDGVSPVAATAEVAPASRHHAAGHLRSGKYRDSGARPATGRSGSAVLSARAVLWRDGVVRLLVTTGDPDHPASAPGELAKVQLRIFSPEGQLLSTANHQRPTAGGSHVFLLPGLVPGARIQVQANVRGIDRRRTDVVTLTAAVRVPASLAAVLDPLPRPAEGVPAVVSATVSETGGVAGAYTACVLRVDGVEVDRIDDVWVDAGDAVSCAFTYTFEREGTYEVSVELAGGALEQGVLVPAPASGTVEVVGTARESFSASVLDRTVATDARFDQWWQRPNGTGRDYAQSTGSATHRQTATLTGTLGRAAALPLASVRLRVASTAGEWHEGSWSGLSDVTIDADGRSCVNRMVPEHGAHFHLCTDGATTTYGYTRFGGTVTYHSRGFARTWDGITGAETYHSWNDVYQTYRDGGQVRPLGTAVTFALEIEDATGTQGATATVPLTAFEEPETGTPYTCREESPYWVEGGVLRTCEGSSERVFGWRGQVTG